MYAGTRKAGLVENPKKLQPLLREVPVPPAIDAASDSSLNITSTIPMMLETSSPRQLETSSPRQVKIILAEMRYLFTSMFKHISLDRDPAQTASSFSAYVLVNLFML